MSHFTTRPVVVGRQGVVTSGHYLATTAGFQIMRHGGNAVDAGAAMAFCLGLLEPQRYTIGGEVPVLVYSAAEGRTFAISGQGWSPQALTVDWCRQHDIDLIPGDGLIGACVPAVVDTWALALARFGTMSFAQVLQPAIELAEEGFAVDPDMHCHIASNIDKYTQQYPTTGAVYCPEGRPPLPYDLLRNPDFAATLRVLCRAEAEASGRGRVAGIEAARDAFYQGEIAERLARFAADTAVEDVTGTAHSGLLSYDDIAGWRAELEEPVSIRYRGLDVHKCPPWTQGPVFLQQLAILEGFDLAAMGHNSADYLHTWLECAKLAFADREAYYGDPRFDDVPLDALLSEPYAAQRRDLIGGTASMAMRPGDVGHGPRDFATRPVLEDNRRALGIAAGPAGDLGLGHAHVGDTTHLDAVDAQGNMVAATPSGAWIPSSPVIPGLGFPLGTRAQIYYLNPERPNALQPHKRPRTTLTPSMVTRDGEPLMAFGTPGGDTQDQTTLQFFLNVIDFEMDIQEALDAPLVYSAHFPSSFYPREGFRGQVHAEARIDPQVLDELRRRGHEIVVDEAWDYGKVTGIRYDKERGIILGGASPRRRLAYAIGW